MSVRWSEEQLADFERRKTAPAPFAPPSDKALGRLPTGTMNKLEAAYADHLGRLQAAGEIRWFKFEAVKLRLANATFYTPDFAVMAADGGLEMHETKGFWRDDARVKIKVAASIYPFRFIGVTRKGANWLREEF